MQESQTITRKSASNLALAFVLLPKAKRDAMSALYAFCREVDDVADDVSVPTEQRRKGLSAWREDIRKACEGGSPEFAVNRELQGVIRSYHLPFDLFNELLLGVEMDLETLRYQTYQELDLYCYRVASVVGLLSIEIFGYQDPRCKEYAVALGKALQLTNILRDVGSDAERDRIYLPMQELARFGVAPEDVLARRFSPQFESLARSAAQRAKDFYRTARTIRANLPRCDRRSMVAAELMGSVYWSLLGKLESRNFDVLGPSITRVPKLQKIALILQSWWRCSRDATAPNYDF
jgi:phytoene synthase